MDVLVALEREGVEFVPHEHRAAFTAQELAAVEHVPGRFVAKPVLVKSEMGYTLCVVPAPAHVDMKAVADALCEGPVRLAHEEELADLFEGCELGAEPPIGAFFGIKTLVDYTLMDHAFLEFQAGTHTRSVRMGRAAFEHVADPMYGAITLSPSGKA